MTSPRPEAKVDYSPTAQQIIRRANELLTLGGYNGFSYADIAESVGVRKASIHHHFPSKVDLVKATVVLHREATRLGLLALNEGGSDPLERLVAYSRYWAQCIEASNPPICICALLATEVPSIPVEIADEVKGHFQELHAWITATIEEGQSTRKMRLVGTPSSEASAFMASIHGAMLSARAVGDPALFWEIANQAISRLEQDSLLDSRN